VTERMWQSTRERKRRVRRSDDTPKIGAIRLDDGRVARGEGHRGAGVRVRFLRVVSVVRAAHS